MPYAELSTELNAIIVEIDWNEKEILKYIPGCRWHPKHKIWTVPLTYPACSQLKGRFGDSLRVGEKLTQWIWDTYNTRIKPSMEWRGQYLFDSHGTGLGVSLAEELKLYTFQRAGVQWLSVAGSGLLGDEPGTGKTIQALMAMKIIGISETLPALVISPNSVKINWHKEAAKWLPDANTYVIAGTASEKNRLLEKAQNDSRALVIINFESLARFSRLAGFGSIRLNACQECDKIDGNPNLQVKSCEVHPRQLNQIPFKLIIVDEAHRIKDPKAKQTRAAWAVSRSPSVRRRWGLTGTPIANNPAELWSIMHCIEPWEYPTKSKFVDLYALQAWNNHGGLDVVGLNPQTKDEFYKIFDPRFRRMPKALVLPQLPPKIREQRFVDMTPRQRKAYQELHARLVTQLEDGSVLVAQNNLSAQVRLLQLSSSYCKIDMGPTPDDISTWTVELTEPSPKLDELMQILEDLGDKKVVVAAEQRKLIELAAARLDKAKIKYGLITGKISIPERDANLQAFQEGDMRVLLFTIKAGGVGLTMTAADTIVFLQRSWSMIDNKQAEDRVHRIGAEHESINVIDVITADTVEEVQLERLNEKMERLEEITRDRKTLQEAGMLTTHLDTEESELLAGFLGRP